MRRLHLLIALAVLLLDRFTKRLVAKEISLHDSITVIKRVFYITHVENRGAAFGLFNDSPSEWKIALLVLFSIVALVIVSALLWRSSHTMTATAVGLSLILAFATIRVCWPPGRRRLGSDLEVGLIVAALLLLGVIVGRVITVLGHSDVRTHTTRENGGRVTLDIGVADLRGSLP